MGDLTEAEQFLDTHVQHEARAMKLAVAWNGNITDFPSWEVSDTSGDVPTPTHLGYVGLSRQRWEVEVMLDDNSFTIRENDLRTALLRLREVGRYFVQADATISDLTEQRRVLEVQVRRQKGYLDRIASVVAPILSDDVASTVGRVHQVRDIITNWLDDMPKAP